MQILKDWWEFAFILGGMFLYLGLTSFEVDIHPLIGWPWSLALLFLMARNQWRETRRSNNAIYDRGFEAGQKHETR